MLLRASTEMFSVGIIGEMRWITCGASTRGDGSSGVHHGAVLLGQVQSEDINVGQGHCGILNVSQGHLWDLKCRSGPFVGS